MSLVYFAILIGVLIFVHELGHFLFAKAFDVRVIRFSIGLGPPIFGFEYGETEYVVCWLPLGGYVQMYGHTFESMEDVDEEDKERALMGKPVWQRSLIAFAGPLFNLLLPVVIYTLVTLGQGTAPPSVVGQVLPDTPAAASGLQSGDRIVAIDGNEIAYWGEISEYVSQAYDRTLTVKVERDGAFETFEMSPEKHTSTDFLGLNSRTYGLIGIYPGEPGPTVAVDAPDGQAAKAGLRHFDRVVAIDGEPVETYRDIVDAVRSSDGEPLEMTVLRRQRLPVSYAQFFSQKEASVTVEPERVDGTWQIGIDPAEMYVTEVDSESPAARAGLRTGDEILKVDGRKYANWRMMAKEIEDEVQSQILERDQSGSSEEIEPEFEVVYERGGERKTTTLKPSVIEYEGESKQRRYRTYVGWGHLSDMHRPDEISVPLATRFTRGFERGVERTWQLSQMMVKGIVRIMQGRVSLDTVGGPIMIGELAAQAGRAGVEYFLQMMALISINLAIINLLPIPVLDGGHLMFYAIEAVRRRPLSFRTRQIATYIGFAIIVFLMLLAFKNDIERNWQGFVEWLNSL